MIYLPAQPLEVEYLSEAFPFCFRNIHKKNRKHAHNCGKIRGFLVEAGHSIDHVRKCKIRQYKETTCFEDLLLSCPG
jgi:DNA primase large subunit